MREKRVIKYFSAVLIIVMMFTQIPYINASAENIKGSKIMVSMGDSYSSGEGVEPFYNQDLSDKEKSTDQDFLAHRSEKSWPGKLKINGITMKDRRNTNWFFVASSGAETVHFNGRKDYFGKGKDHKGKQSKKYFRGGVDTREKPKKLDKQLDVFEHLNDKSLEADYVTMTIGGNDVGFSDIITSSVLEGNHFLQPSALAVKLNFAWHDFYKKGGAKEHIRQAYIDVRKAAGNNTNIIVAGYPKLISTIHSLQPFFTVEEALFINDSVHKFNNEIDSIIKNFKETGEDKKIFFASVEDAFSGHEAYSIDSYINGIEFNNKYDIDKSLVSAYSMHPNEKGTKAYAKCVQKVIDSIEEKEATKKSAALEKKLMSDTWEEATEKGSLIFKFLDDGKLQVKPTGKFKNEYWDESTDNQWEYSIEKDGSVFIISGDGTEYGVIYDTPSKNMLCVGVANSGTIMWYKSSIKPYNSLDLPKTFAELPNKSAQSKLLGGSLQAILTDNHVKFVDEEGMDIGVNDTNYVGTTVSDNIMSFASEGTKDFWLEHLKDDTYLLLVFTYKIDKESGMRQWWDVECSYETVVFN